MISFKEFLLENTQNKIADLTLANKSLSLKTNTNKFLVLRDWTEDEIKEFGRKQTVEAGNLKWLIVDKITPDYKSSFPISEIQNYLNGMYTTQIQVKYALRDIVKGKWSPE